MKQILVLLVIFGGMVCSISSWAAPKYQTLQPGIEYASVQPNQLAKKIHLLRLNLNKISLKPILSHRHGKKVMSAKAMAKAEQAIAVINANFFDRKNNTLGLVLLDGKIKNPFHPTSWWASFLVIGNHAKVAKVFRKAQVRGVQQGVQAGPRLVISGRVPRLKSESSPKSAVGIDRQGRVILLASEGNINIQALAEYLALSTKKGGLGLSNALNLDGGSSTQFYLKTDEAEVWVPGIKKIPVGLGVFVKPPAIRR